MKKELVKNITKDIQEIYSLTNKFKHPDEIHQIDIDLALSKVRNLYDLLLKFNNQPLHQTENQKEEISTIKKVDKTSIIDSKPEKPKPVRPAGGIEEKPLPGPELIIEEPKTYLPCPSDRRATGKKEEIKEEVIKKPKVEVVEKVHHIKEEKQPKETKKTKKTDETPEIVADKFQSKKFVHDNITKKNIKKDVSTKMQSKPIKDINSAIGLNDKFIFIRELFGGDKDYYHETIQILNNFDTFDNALEFLNENFDWDPDDSNFERLKELVRRKYS